MKRYHHLHLILGIVLVLLGLVSSLVVTRAVAVDEKTAAQDKVGNVTFALEINQRNNPGVDLLLGHAASPAFAALARPESIAPLSPAGLTFTVNSTADPGSGGCDVIECTLREAITAANSAAGSDNIDFNIPGPGPHTITPSTPLPTITTPVVIDGYTQPGASANTLADDDNAVLMIELNGSVAAEVNMIHITAGSSTVRGLVINRCDRAIGMDTNGGNTIEGNFIGSNVAGNSTTGLGNDYGVIISSGSFSNVIGGTTPAARNLISGNNFGIGLQAATGSTVQGNFIGTDRTGSNDLGNDIGVSATASSTNTIGGTVAGSRNVISGNGTGIRMQANNNVIQGNYIGVNATGGAFNYSNISALGITIFSSTGNTVGGTTPAARNVISGNSIGLSLGSAASTIVQGNFVGTNAAGTAALGNTATGLDVSNSTNSVIGGTVAGAGNLISANGTGLSISGSTGLNIQVQGNLVGTDVTGTADLGNTGDGVVISGGANFATNITIGGTVAGARNVISGNNGDGIDLRNLTGTVVQDNLIGLQIDGLNPLGNGGAGINIVGTFNNTIGGTAPGAANRIAFNGAGTNSGGGIIVDSVGTNNNPLRGNSIFANTSNGTLPNRGLGIDLSLSGSGNGPTPNDACDGDTGPNNLQNFPVVTSVITSSGSTTIQGTLDSTAATSFTIDFYSNSSSDPSGFGEGETYLGSTTTTPNGGCSYTFSFTTPSPVPGTRVVTATATDPSGNTSEFSGTFPVSAVNNAPSFTKGPDQTGNEDAGPQSIPNWATNISAGSPDEAGQTLNFIVTNDNNALFSAQPAISNTGTLTFTPAPNAFGITTVTVQLHDDGGTANGGQDTSAAQTFSITVNAVNDSPSFTKGPDQTVAEDSGSQSVPNWATNIAAGPPNEAGQTLNFIVTNDNNVLFSAQPAISNTGTLTYTPAPGTSGAATVSVQLHDNGGTANGGQDTSATQTFTITVNPANVVNNAPSFTKGPDQTVNEDAGVQAVPNWATNISAGPPSEAGQTLNFIVTNDNNALFSVQPAISDTGTLTYTAAPDAFGITTVTVQLHDNGGTANGGQDTSAAQTFSITVNAVNDSPSFTKGPDQTVAEDSGAQSVSNWATNIAAGPPNEAGQTLNFIVTNDNNALFSAQPAISNTGTLTFTPAPNAFGITTVTVQLHDDGGTANGGQDTSAAQTFTITVNAVNDAPSFTKGADQTVNEDAGAQSVPNWATNISAGPPDEVGQTLNFIVTNDNNALFSVQPAISETGTLTYTPAPNAFGSTPVVVRLHDNGGTANGGQDTSAEQFFIITINAVNDLPSFTKGADQTVNEDAGAQSVPNWATNISAGPPNEAGQTLNFIVTNDNNTLFSVQPGISNTGTLTYTPAPGASGAATVTVQLHDNGGTANGGQDTSATQTFTITVNPGNVVNNAPSFTKGPDQTVNEDAGVQNVPNWATNISAGPPSEAGQTLNFIVTNDNNALFSVQPAISDMGTLTYTPAPDAFGATTVTVQLHDNGGTANGGQDTSAAQTFSITVNAVNDSPSFTKGPDQTVAEDSGAQSVPNWATNISAGPPSEAGQTLNFIVTNDNNALFSVQPAISDTGTLTYTPAPDAFGATTVTVQLHDNGGTANGGQDTSATQTFSITVNAVNDSPSFTKGPDQTVVEGSGAQSVANWATSISPGPANESSQTLTFLVQNNTNPALFSVAPAISSTGTLTYALAADANGSATITIALEDNGGGADTSPSQTFVITVTEVNEAPDLTITKTHAGNFSAGQTGASYTIRVTNVDTGPTSGLVTVIDSVPVELTPTGPTGVVNGWACSINGQTLTCTRSDVLAGGASYPDINLTVNVANPAPLSVTNTAAVAGGGDVNPSNNSASDPTAITCTQDFSSNNNSPLVISRFRENGPAGATDEFVEIFNPSTTTHTVASGTCGGGYGIFASAGNDTTSNSVSLICQIPNGTQIPAGGYYLCTGATYSLDNLGRNGGAAGANAVGDAPIGCGGICTANIPDDAGLALMNVTQGVTLTTAGFNGGVVDAGLIIYDRVGFGPYGPGAPAAGYPSLAGNFCEGPCLQPVGDANILGICTDPSGVGRFPVIAAAPACYGQSGQYEFLRRQTSLDANLSTLHQDTNNSAEDFIFNSPNPGTNTGLKITGILGVSAVLGAARPYNSSAPPDTPSSSLMRRPFDGVDQLGPRNAERRYSTDPSVTDPANDPYGTFTLRFRYTNNSGVAINGLRFEVDNISTFCRTQTGVGTGEARNLSSSPNCGDGNLTAILKVLNSAREVLVDSSGTAQIVNGTVMEDLSASASLTPAGGGPLSPLGGGLDNTLVVNQSPLGSSVGDGVTGGSGSFGTIIGTTEPTNVLRVKVKFGVVRSGRFMLLITPMAKTSPTP